jgi:hypothetical protein
MTKSTPAPREDLLDRYGVGQNIRPSLVPG